MASIQKCIVVFGSGAVGKSAMTIQYINGTFVADYDPTIEETYTKTTQIDKRTYSVEVLDTAGEEEFLSMRLPYIRKGDAFILIYSIDNRISYDEIEHFHSDILRNKGRMDVPIVLCGNKSDLEEKREVTKIEGEVLAHKMKCPFFETSAKTNTNIKEAFEEAVREIIRKSPKEEPVTKEEPKEPSFWARLCLLF